MNQLTREQLIAELKYMNHSRERRDYYAQLFMGYPKNIQLLLEIAFDVHQKNSFRAAWVLEFMCSADLNYLIPHLDLFTENIKKVKHDSAKRPMAKICEIIAVTYFNKERHPIKKHLSQKQKEQIIEAAFDWMINDEKVAVKAYSMNCLYLFGTEIDWIHPELQIILEKDFSSQSAAFKARARHILKKIKR
ncbi:MAG: adenylosuccinate lyase [Bacteroidota bacterium]